MNKNCNEVETKHGPSAEMMYSQQRHLVQNPARLAAARCICSPNMETLTASSQRRQIRVLTVSF